MTTNLTQSKQTSLMKKIFSCFHEVFMKKIFESFDIIFITQLWLTMAFSYSIAILVLFFSAKIL